ncbi:MAG: hypothetical protein LBT30_08055 [Clostridiales bacterium]|jgi:hypothetical protein|nr:hypothetical protein [Clostridiales bacterium]
MNYGDIKKINTVITENEFFENKIGYEKAESGAEAAVVPRKKLNISFPHLKLDFFKGLKNKLDIYDAVMIPVGAGILVAFIMLILKVV